MSIYKTIKLLKKCLVVAIAQFCITLFSSCGEAPGQANLIVLCSIKKVDNSYAFPLQEIILNKTKLDIGLQEGQNMGGRGLKYRGQSNKVFSDLIIVSYSVSKSEESGKPDFQMVETLSVVDGKIPARNDQSLPDYIKYLRGN